MYEFDDDLREYIYLSDAKLQDAYPQLHRRRSILAKFPRTRVRVPVGGQIDINFQQPNAGPNRYEKLDTIIATMERRGEVGTPRYPNRYFKGILPMRWDVITDDEDMVYFGYMRDTWEGTKVVVLAGSSQHLREDLRPERNPHSYRGRRAYSANVGHITAAVTRHLTTTAEWAQDLAKLSGSQLSASLQAHVALVHELSGPDTRLEFFAKRLYRRRLVCQLSRHGDPVPVELLLGTPYYVAMYD